MTRRIRLAYVITDLQVGGVPLHLHRLATRLDRRQFDVHVVSLAEAGPVGRELQDAGIPVRACEARGVADVRALWRLWRALRAIRPDIVHSLLFHANLAVRFVGPAAGVPPGRIICEIQTVEVERKWHLVLDNLTCRWCRCEVGNSPSVVRHLLKVAHVPASRLRSEWGAVDVDAAQKVLAADRASLGIGEEHTVVLWSGRLDPVKGFEQMFSAFAAAFKDRPARFVLAGEGPYRAEIDRLIERLGLKDQVLLLGRRHDVPALLKMADIFLFCSRTEGMPNAVLEAMAAGLPVIVTDVPGCRDLVRHGQTGLLVRFGDVRETSRALRLVDEDRVFAGCLARAGQEWVRRSAT